MSRTSEQIAADQQLTDAINAVRQAYYDGESEFLLTDYVVLCTSVRFDDEGDKLTASEIIYRDGDVPLVRALGMLRYAQVRVEKEIASDEE